MMPVISIFCRTAMTKTSATKAKIHGDRGSPCLTPRSKVKKSEIVPLFIIQLWICLYKVLTQQTNSGPKLKDSKHSKIKSNSTHFL